MSKKNEKKDEEKSLLFRTNTMDRTVEEGNEFLQDFDPDLRSKKRKERDEERKRSQSPNKRVKRSSKSPKRSPKRSKSPKKNSPKKAKKPQRATRRSTSPKKTRVSSRATPVRNAISPPPKPTVSLSPVATPVYTPPVSSAFGGFGGLGFGSGYCHFLESPDNFFVKPETLSGFPVISSANFSRPIIPEWQFQSSSPSFALTVNNGKVWFGNDSGEVFGFTLAGEMKRRIKLPSGVKCLVADMGHWLYAGCDDGIVYDLSREDTPRIAYEIDSAVSIDNYLEIENQRNKKRNIIFVLDRSGSMANTRITAAGKNLSMVYNHHLREDDKITLIEFNDFVHVRFASFSKNNDKQRTEMERLYFHTIPTFCSGSTALWDAIDIAYQKCEDDSLVENWIILLTDGEDNRSRTANFATVLEKTKSKKENTNLLVIGVGLNEAKNDLKTICQIHSKDLYIPVNASGAAEGITEAFKLVTQMLSSKIIGMEIRDGLIAVSDNLGNLSACDIEGNQNWSRKSKGTCGWVIKADFEGIYHGHTLGVSKYSPMDGNLLWEAEISTPILYGFLDRRDHILYLSSGRSIYLLSAKTGEQLGYYLTTSPLICNAYDFDNHRLFAADNQGRIFCFNSGEDREKDGKLILASVTGTSILSLYYADNKLFASTSDGKLSAYDVSEPAITLLKPIINGGANLAPLPATRKVTTLETLEISQPTPHLPVMPKDRLSDEVIVECYREFDDLQIKEIANSLHNISFNSIQIEGVDYPILLSKDGLRYVKIKGLILTQQDPEKQMNFNYKLGEKEVDKYAELAKNGSKVTWVVNGEKEWGLIIDGEVKENGSRLLIRPAANDRGYDVTKIVQFPRSARILNAIYCVQSLTLSENGQYYRSSGEICRIDNEV